MREVVTVSVDIDLLRKQRDFVLTLGLSHEREGLTNMLDAMLDVAEGYGAPQQDQAVLVVSSEEDKSVVLFTNENQAREALARNEGATLKEVPLMTLVAGEKYLAESFGPETPKNWIGATVVDASNEKKDRVAGNRTFIVKQTRKYAEQDSLLGEHQWCYLSDAERVPNLPPREAEDDDSRTEITSELRPSPWTDNTIQFPRLLAEILATQDLNLATLCDSMDIEQAQLHELFERADQEWERIKSNL
jgi:hypothetical protein